MNNTTTAGEAGPSSGHHSSNSATEGNFETKQVFLRLLFMIVVAFIYGVSRIVIGAVILLQFLWALFAHAPNDRLSKLGQSLATYTYQIVCYLTFVSENRPYPFDLHWPKGPVQ